MVKNNLGTRMHYSRMRTVRCSGHWGRVSQNALGGGGVSIPACTGQGVSAQGLYTWGGVCLGGVSSRGVCLGGVYQGGVCLGWCLLGGCLPRGYLPKGMSAWGAIHPTPVDRMTDACENITLLQLNCGR